MQLLTKLVYTKYSYLRNREMSLLNDQALHKLATENIISGGPSQRWEGKDDPIQASSIDLHIGKIFVPGEYESDGGPAWKKMLSLTHGRTAVLETMEELRVPNEYAAIGFPPSHVSSKGLLMTNPGHVDPGYSGSMRFTVINMAK